MNFFIRETQSMRVYCLALCAAFFCTMTYTHNILITSIPKSGTHLVIKCVHMLLKQKILRGKTYTWLPSFTHFKNNEVKKEQGKILVGHLFCDNNNKDVIRKNSIKTIFIYRDPRDQVVSLAHWIKKTRPRFKDKALGELITLALQDVSLALDGSQQWNKLPQKTSLNEFYRMYMPFKTDPTVCALQFEKLIGEQGGGNKIDQIQQIVKMALYLEKPLSAQQLKDIMQDLFGPEDLGSTFREGQIGSWKKYFTEEHKKMFKDIAGQLLIELGYETDLNW